MNSEDLPKIIESAKKCKFVMNIYFEKHFDKDLNEFR